jgi:N-acetylmuramoyl-L-alanine amidase
MPRVCFISIHFDALGSESLQSARVIAGKNASDLSILLEKKLEEERRISNCGVPVVKNGDKTHGVKNIYVLSDANQVRQKAMLELGNFNNPSDLWRIRDFKVRENYAQIITRALIELNAQPIKH